MKKFLIATLFSLAATSVMADGAMKPMYNGIMSEAISGSRAELIADGNMIMIYLTSHHGEDIATQGSSGELTLLTGKDKQVLTLLPSGGNAVMVQGQFKLISGTKALAKVTLPGKAVDQFRFEFK